MANDRIGGPVAVLNLADEARLDPMDALLRHPLGEHDRRLGPCDRVEALPQLDQLLIVEPGADPAGVAQLPIRVIIAEQQRAEAEPLTARVGKADYDELVPVQAFYLEPLGAAARTVGPVAPLRDD